ncbi:MAG: DUF86 domain-containing protein [Brevinematia bacterium]
MKIIESILRFEKHYDGILKLKNEDLREYLIYNTMAMECFQAINALIEIGEYIVTKYKLGFPSTYRQIFEILYNEKYITKEEFEVFKRLVFLRNLISHEYYTISAEELLEMSNLFDKIAGFIKQIKQK